MHEQSNREARNQIKGDGGSQRERKEDWHRKSCRSNSRLQSDPPTTFALNRRDSPHTPLPTDPNMEHFCPLKASDWICRAHSTTRLALLREWISNAVAVANGAKRKTRAKGTRRGEEKVVQPQ